jgi:hypothetical protein
MNQFRSSPEARERWDRYWRAGGYEDFSDFVRQSLDAASGESPSSDPSMSRGDVVSFPPPPLAVPHIGRPETGHHPSCFCSSCNPPEAA